MREGRIIKVISMQWENDPLQRSRELQSGDMPELESLAISRIVYDNIRLLHRAELWTDSDSLVQAFPKGGAQNRFINAAIQLLHRLNITVNHVYSEDNPADYYSRLK